MPTVTPKAAAALSAPGRHAAKKWNELEELPEAVPESPPDERTSPDGPAELCEGTRRPRNAVADRQSAQHDREDTSETAHTDEGDRNSPRASGGGAVAINQRPGLRPYPVALGVSPREVQGLKRSGPGFLEGEPKHLDSHSRGGGNPSSGIVKSIGTKRGGGPGNPSNNRRW